MIFYSFSQRYCHVSKYNYNGSHRQYILVRVILLHNELRYRVCVYVKTEVECAKQTERAAAGRYYTL